jgi:hypothetical protein
MNEVINGGLLSILPKSLREVALKITEEDMAIPEDELEKMVRPAYTLYAMRRNLWREIEKCMRAGGGKGVQAPAIWGGVCSKINYQYLLKKKENVVWLMQQAKEYDHYMAVMVDMAMSRYKDLINMEITTQRKVKNVDGEYEMVTQTCPKKAFVLLQTLKQLEDRALGKPVERQIRINEKAEDGDKVVGFDMDAINNRLKELEHRLGEGGNGQGQVHIPTVLAGKHEAGGASGDYIEEGAYEE